MFFLPFLFAGVFMLTIVNPPYTATLLSHAMPHFKPLLSASLARRLSKSNSLARVPWDSHSNWLAIKYFPTLPSSTGYEDDAEAAALAYSKASSHGSPMAWFAARLPREVGLVLSTASTFFSPAARDMLVLFISLFMLRGCCSWIVHKFRVPQPASPALEFVEELRQKNPGQAFTPSSSFNGSQPSPDRGRGEDDHPPLCGLATPEGIVFYPKAMLDTVLATPLCLVSSTGQSWDVDSHSSSSSPVPGGSDDAIDDHPQMLFAQINTSLLTEEQTSKCAKPSPLPLSQQPAASRSIARRSFDSLRTRSRLETIEEL